MPSSNTTATAKGPPIFDRNALPEDLSAVELPPLAGADGGYTKVQRYIVQSCYIPIWIEMNEGSATGGELSAWKGKAIKEIIDMPEFAPLRDSVGLVKVSSSVFRSVLTV